MEDMQDSDVLVPILSAAELVLAKLADAATPAVQVEFQPDEAAMAGAFEETALSEADALDSTPDLLEA